MALTPTQWGDELRASIAQVVGAMRNIQTLEQQPEWKPYFDGWMKDTTLSKDTRKTVKHLLPAVISMAEDMDNTVLTELGINANALPLSSPFAANQDIEPKALKIAQIDMLEKPTATAQAVLIMTNAGRTVRLSIFTKDGVQILPPQTVAEVLPSIFSYSIDWSQLAVADGYYIVKVEDGYEMDVKTVEIKTQQNQSHTQADKIWMLQNLGGGNNPPVVSAGGGFI